MFGEVQQILLEVGKPCTANTADHALEAQRNHIIVQTNGFKQLRAAVGGNGRDAHFGHDFVQTFVDAVTVVQHHGPVIFGNRLSVDQTSQCFIREIRIDCRRAKTEQDGKMVRIAGTGGFNDDVGVAAQALFYQTRLHCAHGHRRRNRQTIFSDVAVREYQQYRAVAHHLFRLIAQCFDGLFERSFGRVEGDIQTVSAIMLLFHGGELGEIGVQQDRRFKAQAVCLTFSFAEDVHLTTDAGGQRHDVRFTQRVDRRVGDLRELLAEVVINDARLAGEYGKRGIVTH